jgi:hypothetical protein
LESAEYIIDFILRNSAKKFLFNTAKLQGIPFRFVYTSTESREPSNENSSMKKIKKSTKGMVYAVEDFYRNSVKDCVY